jgi:hypothetical protein
MCAEVDEIRQSSFGWTGSETSYSRYPGAGLPINTRFRVATPVVHITEGALAVAVAVAVAVGDVLGRAVAVAGALAVTTGVALEPTGVGRTAEVRDPQAVKTSRQTIATAIRFISQKHPNSADGYGPNACDWKMLVLGSLRNVKRKDR